MLIFGHFLWFGSFLFQSNEKHYYLNQCLKYPLHYFPIHRDASRCSDCAVSGVFLRSQPNRLFQVCRIYRNAKPAKARPRNGSGKSPNRAPRRANFRNDTSLLLLVSSGFFHFQRVIYFSTPLLGRTMMKRRNLAMAIHSASSVGKSE